MERLPRAGRAIESLTEAMRMYRRRPGVLLIAAAMSIVVHSFFAIGIYLIARGLPGHVHTLGTHFVLSPLSAATGVLPLPLGPFELVLEYLYVHVPLSGAFISPGQGLVVALGYRLITVLIAAIGACYYLGARQEIAQSIRQASEDEPLDRGPTIAMSNECNPASAA